MLLSFTQWDTDKKRISDDYQGTKIEINIHFIEYVIELNHDNIKSQIGLTSGKTFNLVETQSEVIDKVGLYF